MTYVVGNDDSTIRIMKKKTRQLILRQTFFFLSLVYTLMANILLDL